MWPIYTHLGPGWKWRNTRQFAVGLLSIHYKENKMTMTKPRKRLGELVLRSENPQALVRFYQNVVGLEPFATVGSSTFLKVDNDVEGHPQLLAIFEKTHEFSGPKDLRPDNANAQLGTLHHFAFVLEPDEFASEQDRLRRTVDDVQLAEHSPFGWHSLYMYDPDGNSVEFVCYDPSILDIARNQQVMGKDTMDSVPLGVRNAS